MEITKDTIKHVATLSRLAFNEEELDKFTKNIPAECKSIYLGHNVLPTQEQEDLFRIATGNIEKAPIKLVDLANENGGLDNITAIVIKNI